MNGGGNTGFCWYSITTVNRWNIQTYENYNRRKIAIVETHVHHYIKKQHQEDEPNNNYKKIAVDLTIFSTSFNSQKKNYGKFHAKRMKI